MSNEVKNCVQSKIVAIPYTTELILQLFQNHVSRTVPIHTIYVCSKRINQASR